MYLNKAKRPGQVIALDGLLAIYQKALIVWEDKRYACRLEDFDAHVLSFTAPLDEHGMPIYLEAGTQLEVILEAQERFYGFNTTVVTSKNVEGIQVVVCVRPSVANSTDRRGYFRVPVNIPLGYSFSKDAHKHRGRVIDLSGGGALCLVDARHYVQHGQQIELEFSLPGTMRSLELSAVVRMVKMDATISWQRVSCEFVQIDERTREKIIHYVARRQLELIRLGGM